MFQGRWDLPTKPSNLPLGPQNFELAPCPACAIAACVTLKSRPLLLALLLMAFAVRTVLGAPCCLDSAHAAETNHVEAEAEHHSDHSDHAQDTEHDSHGDDSAANPCCSACGPTLPTVLAKFTPGAAIKALHAPEAIRSLATRPPFPAYDATGPPFLSCAPISAIQE